MCQRDKKLYKEGERERLRGLEIEKKLIVISIDSLTQTHTQEVQNRNKKHAST